MPPKRPPASSTQQGPAKKRAKATGVSVSIGASRVAIKSEPDEISSGDANANGDDLRNRFIQLLSGNAGGLSNSSLKAQFGQSEYPRLVPIINVLTQESRLVMSRVGDELFYSLVGEELASQMAGLDLSARLVYQVIEKAGNKGIWTKDIRTQTNVQQQTLTKIFKTLESRRLIKPVKSVTAKSKKLYMLYNLTPAKELTGGPWYTELEFDHEYINHMRRILHSCVRRMNGGQGVTLTQIRDKMIEAKVSRVELSLDDVQQLVQALAFDHLVESATNAVGETVFVASRRVTPMCEFKWWDALSPDFNFRDVVFEDGIRIRAHEPHHHTA